MRILILLLLFLSVSAFAQDNLPPFIPTRDLPACTDPITVSPCRCGVNRCSQGRPGQRPRRVERKAHSEWAASTAPVGSAANSILAGVAANPGKAILGLAMTALIIAALFMARGVSRGVDDVEEAYWEERDEWERRANYWEQKARGRN